MRYLFLLFLVGCVSDAERKDFEKIRVSHDCDYEAKVQSWNDLNNMREIYIDTYKQCMQRNGY